jgi:hypothetical protein
MNQVALAHEAPPIATSALNRRLVAIAFADVAGSSRLMALNDVETVRINRPIRAFAIEWVEGGKSDTQPYLQWSSRPTVAVLPFRTISGSDKDRYFGEGITDEIVTELSRSRGLYVIARGSTLRYRDRGKGRAVSLQVPKWSAVKRFLRRRGRYL